jgi:hypothetical protein
MNRIRKTCKLEINKINGSDVKNIANCLQKLMHKKASELLQYNKKALLKILKVISRTFLRYHFYWHMQLQIRNLFIYNPLYYKDAFDSAIPDILFHNTKRAGLSSCFLDFIMDSCKNATIRIWNQKKPPILSQLGKE